ncbi:tRNA (adenosine(37)-N6)-threonylcarbamoyltransferase complex transferase subunit TsaD [Leptospira bandrabouensis]|uniref:tRNA (adenosine(37)-N6)-threonylcarbamoyltransferase complex transferase subunit TsaD n=1 Tax=Leptospira bandrabouensis TaxID=2484903 RepID=UPI00223E84C0|nr:tRNA (adenosine(37)-N6)-threonylcarbamoyltransferase complex transferase subunit TsaD [Leptospira bandrabouensis]MCW7457794.1 tRNA (adenosine(37)-N6)-threonylcarbamoyltransferase complex transferase subunit TsaD [Leptospira bandrabouensis]MCW7477466.1 tRNA (adenosine(37)-N6)-threonylcarbamoyltransferase complex transferase subunit TsaD [Leptospira bandrabouensis]MCW7485148.1 tRNA (adenosine(37)-N6)-threonylcarbamoyltransferase complex transferase subunit TsaD [Leptospira bandrabouensis]
MAYGLGIESSCDETSIAIVRDGRELLSLKVYSQIDSHSPYRGVVPEIASRAHLEKINSLLSVAMEEAGIEFSDLNYVAVTSYPGLVGSLMIGAQLARCISLVYGIPIVAVNHLEAHLAVIGLERELPPFPWLGLLLSGGNSSIYIYKGFGDLQIFADTQDDSLGEAFDKVSAVLDLPYPGGPYLEAKANAYSPIPGEKNPFPKLLKEDGEDLIRFSYSGLKTAVLYYKRENAKSLPIEKIAYYFQKTAFELVTRNLGKAISKTGIRTVVAAGGVLANGTLRDSLEKEKERSRFDLFYPSKKIYCTDNGAMVACLGYHLWKQKSFVGLDFKVSPKRNFEQII